MFQAWHFQRMGCKPEYDLNKNLVFSEVFTSRLLISKENGKEHNLIRQYNIFQAEKLLYDPNIGILA